MYKINWDEVSDQPEFPRPQPGGYIAVIRDVIDNEAKEYLEIHWDFRDGDLAGSNQDTFDRLGWWPIKLFRSYKESARGMFKGFKKALEVSNTGYHFQEDDLEGMIGLEIGVVLGEEEYQKKDGEIGKRLYVDKTRSVEAIEDCDYQVPPLKTLAPAHASGGWTPPKTSGPAQWDQETSGGNLPF